MLQSSMSQNQINGIRKSLNMADMHRMGEQIKNKDFPSSSPPVSQKPMPEAAVKQLEKPGDKPIIRQSGNTHREISRPLDLFSQPLSRNRVAKTKEAESYHKGKDSVTPGEKNNVLKSINMMQSQQIRESSVYNPNNNRTLNINNA
tara:strand:+ start:21 stop:458 length:438 start_codon:yes stop_codon:yes gene_type:complete